MSVIVVVVVDMVGGFFMELVLDSWFLMFLKLAFLGKQA
jgi:hypothetical protein